MYYQSQCNIEVGGQLLITPPLLNGEERAHGISLERRTQSNACNSEEKNSFPCLDSNLSQWVISLTELLKGLFITLFT